jgi:hypothetical protein
MSIGTILLIVLILILIGAIPAGRIAGAGVTAPAAGSGWWW